MSENKIYNEDGVEIYHDGDSIRIVRGESQCEKSLRTSARILLNKISDLEKQLQIAKEENEALTQQNKLLREALEKLQDNLDNILLPDYEEDYGNYNDFYQSSSAIIQQALGGD